MALQVYNTLTRQKEPFEPLNEGRVLMYVCGPTVYDSTHVGHAMSYIVFDVIRRYLEFRGYSVRHAQNFTDIEDKIIARAQRLGIAPEELADRYSREFMRNMEVLGIKEAHLYPRATAEVPSIIKMVQGLVDKGYAYAANGNVYFKVAAFEGYGKLSGRSLADMRAGEDVQASEQKADPADFALWKAAKTGEPAWDSPWGPGRPGWHIECSAMCYHHLGEQVDIHGGGMDLIFPHHENEIAQAEAFTGRRPFVKYWIHNGLLQLGEEKMSKSLGNLVTVEDFVREHEPDALRLFVFSSYYRRPLTYTEEAIGAAERGLERLRSGLRPPHSEGTSDGAALQEAAQRTRETFIAAMDDDFNTPQALAALFDLVKAINQARDEGVAGPGFETAQGTLRELAGVLGLRLELPLSEQVQVVAPFVDLLVRVRSDLRTARQWALADQIREELTRLGIALEDGPSGTTWRVR